MTRDELRSILSYNAGTGAFTWRVTMPPRGRIGAVAGNDNGSGYIKISIRGKRYYAHRLAFIWMDGSNPAEVDHINQCRSDNRWINLRPSNRSENGANVACKKGIRFRYGKWYARRSDTHLGAFASMDDAVSARRAAVCTAAGLDPNAREIEAKPQVIAKHATRKDLFNGKTLSEWSRITGIPQPTLHWRIYKSGWAIERATADRRTSRPAEAGPERSASRPDARSANRPSG